MIRVSLVILQMKSFRIYDVVKHAVGGTRIDTYYIKCRSIVGNSIFDSCRLNKISNVKEFIN